MSTDMDEARIDDAHISIGARGRLVAPSPLLELRADTGTVIRPDQWDGYYIVRLDAPARLRHDEASRKNWPRSPRQPTTWKCWLTEPDATVTGSDRTPGE